MNQQFIWSSATFVSTALICVLSLLFSRTDETENWDVSKKSKSRRISKWLFVPIVILNLISLVSSLVLFNKQQEVKDAEINEKKADLIVQQKHYDTTLLKIDSANAGLTITLDSINNIQKKLEKLARCWMSKLHSRRKLIF